MSRALSLLIVGLFLSTASPAQELNRSLIEFSAGAGFPVGVFGSKRNTIEAGLAETGFSLSLDFHHYFRPKLGFWLGVKNSVFALDVDTWTNSNPNATSDPWKVLMGYAGLATRRQVRPNTILSLKAAIGIAASQYPEATIINYGGWGPVVTTFTSTTGTAPSFLGGLNLKYIISEKIHLGLNVDYLTASPKFVVTRQVTFNGLPSSTDTSPYTQNIQAFTAGLSVSYNFLRR
jgi:hypothetical protein